VHQSIVRKRRRGSSVGDQEGDRASFVDLSGEREGEGTVGIPKDACCNVGESGS